MMIMRPPASGKPSASDVLGKSLTTNANGFVRVFDDEDVTKLRASGWTIAGEYPEDDYPALAKAELIRADAEARVRKAVAPIMDQLAELKKIVDTIASQPVPLHLQGRAISREEASR